MNNVTCEIVQDLLPLYCDGACSEESRELIKTHIRSCDRCREELRLMSLPVELAEDTVEVNAAEAASRVWKKNKRKAFRRGLILAALLAAITIAAFLGARYVKTSAMDDLGGLERQLETISGADLAGVQKIRQKGDYLAVSAYNEDGLWYLGIYTRDPVFADRWRACGSLEKVKPGDLANWNYQTPEGDTILVCFGAELSDSISGYTFTNSGVTYTCLVDGQSVLDFFFIPDAYDSRTHLEPIYQP